MTATVRLTSVQANLTSKSATPSLAIQLTPPRLATPRDISAMPIAMNVGSLTRLVRTQPPGWFKRTWPEEIADAPAAVVRRLRADHGGVWSAAHADAAPPDGPQGLAGPRL